MCDREDRPLDGEVFVLVEPLAPSCSPAHVVRKHGNALLFVDSNAPRLEILRYVADALTVAEQNAIRDGFGWPRVGVGSVPDEWVDCTGSITAPEALVLPA